MCDKQVTITNLENVSLLWADRDVCSQRQTFICMKIGWRSGYKILQWVKRCTDNCFLLPSNDFSSLIQFNSEGKDKESAALTFIVMQIVCDFWFDMYHNIFFFIFDTCLPYHFAGKFLMNHGIAPSRCFLHRPVLARKSKMGELCWCRPLSCVFLPEN